MALRRPSISLSETCIHQCQCPRTMRPPRRLNVDGKRSFHPSQPHLKTKLRKEMIEWFEGPGKAFRKAPGWRTNYITAYQEDGRLKRMRKAPDDFSSAAEDFRQRKAEEDAGLSKEERENRMASRTSQGRAASQDYKDNDDELRPFPNNTQFRSQSVLSMEMREDVYHQVVNRKIDVSSVSAAYGIDVRRVAAVVRLKTIEKQWEKEGKSLAKPYNNAVLSMLPVTPFKDSNGRVVQHETINDLPVHPATRYQLFWPASESRVFNREDAAKAFDERLLPADKRIAHPELIEIEKWTMADMKTEERRALLRERDNKIKQEKAEKEKAKQRYEARTQRTVHGVRWDFKFQDIKVESVGKDGRGKSGVGYRYGRPYDDRKRGISKIPKSVE